MPVIKALSEGKAIQWYDDNTDTWVDAYGIDLEESAKSYRIKPEPKYRPFRNAEECWEEMKKHQPFGWVKYQDKKSYTLFCNVNDNCDLEADFENYNFIDGTPFGIKME